MRAYAKLNGSLKAPRNECQSKRPQGGNASVFDAQFHRTWLYFLFMFGVFGVRNEEDFEIPVVEDAVSIVRYQGLSNVVVSHAHEFVELPKNNKQTHKCEKEVVERTEI